MAYIGSRPDNVVSRQSSKTYRYTATAGQTVFSGADQDNQILAITPSDAEVHMNGLMLDPTDYTLTGTSVTLSTAATAGDELTVTGRQTFEVADTYTKTAADSRYVNTTGDTMTGQLVVQNASATSTTAQTNLNARFVSNASNADSHIQISNGVDHSANIGIAGGANLYFANDGVEQLRIDSAGRVTMPYQPTWSISRGINQWYATSTGGVIPFYNYSYWSGTHITGVTSNGSGRVTVPVNGRYQIGINIYLQKTGVSSDTYLYLMKNGSLVQYCGSQSALTGTYYDSLVMNHTISLAAGDYLEVVGGSTTFNVYGTSTFSGHLIG